MSQTSSGHVGMLPLKRVRERGADKFSRLNSVIIYATLAAPLCNSVSPGRVHVNTQLAKVVHGAWFVYPVGSEKKKKHPST